MRSQVLCHEVYQDIRYYAQEQGMGVEISLAVGMEEKAKEFRETGNGIYRDA